MNKVYVGLDLGSSTFQPAAINQDGVDSDFHTRFVGRRPSLISGLLCPPPSTHSV
jgi:hypothetical protein